MTDMVADGHKLLVCCLGDRRYAFDLTKIAEVADPPALWPIPLAPGYYAGAMNFHGAIVAVMNLGAFLGLPAGREPEKVVVLAPGCGMLAFLVDRVASIIVAGKDDLLSHPEIRFAKALVALPEGEAVLLDVEAIVNEASETINN